MWESYIKEQLAVHYLGLLATKAGFRYGQMFSNATDVYIEKVQMVDTPNGKIYLETGKFVGIQLKTTTEDWVFEKDNNLIYDLKANEF